MAGHSGSKRTSSRRAKRTPIRCAAVARLSFNEGRIESLTKRVRADAKARHQRLHAPRTTKQLPGERLHPWTARPGQANGRSLAETRRESGTLTPDTERTLAAG
jgi:hypothetical protein